MHGHTGVTEMKKPKAYVKAYARGRKREYIVVIPAEMPWEIYAEFWQVTLITFTVLRAAQLVANAINLEWRIRK